MSLGRHRTPFRTLSISRSAKERGVLTSGRIMTIQFLICIPLVPILFLLTSVSTTARSLAVIDDSLTRGRLTWNAIEPRQKQIDGRNLEKPAIRVPIDI